MSSIDNKTAYELRQSEDMERELSELLDKEDAPVVVTYAEFTRRFLPILSEIATSGELNHDAYLQVVGNYYSEIHVLNPENTEVMYRLPSLLARLDTAVIEMGNPDSLAIEMQQVNLVRDQNPTAASDQINRLGDKYYRENGYGGIEQSKETVAAKYEVLNRIFRDHELPEIEIPPMILGVDPAVHTDTKAPKKQETTNYDFDEGDEL